MSKRSLRRSKKMRQAQARSKNLRLRGLKGGADSDCVGQYDLFSSGEIVEGDAIEVHDNGRKDCFAKKDLKIWLTKKNLNPITNLPFSKKAYNYIFGINEIDQLLEKELEKEFGCPKNYKVIKNMPEKDKIYALLYFYDFYGQKLIWHRSSWPNFYHREHSKRELKQYTNSSRLGKNLTKNAIVCYDSALAKIKKILKTDLTEYEKNMINNLLKVASILKDDLDGMFVYSRYNDIYGKPEYWKISNCHRYIQFPKQELIQQFKKLIKLEYNNDYYKKLDPIVEDFSLMIYNFDLDNFKYAQQILKESLIQETTSLSEFVRN